MLLKTNKNVFKKCIYDLKNTKMLENLIMRIFTTKKHKNTTQIWKFDSKSSNIFYSFLQL